MEHYERDGNLYGCAEDYKNHFGMVCAVCDARLLKWLTCPTGTLIVSGTRVSVRRAMDAEVGRSELGRRRSE